MKLKTKFKGGCLVFALMATLVRAGVCRADDITYNLVPVEVASVPPGVYVTGTITTDGTIGVLSTANIIAWDIDLSQSGFPDEILSSSTISNDVLVQGSYLTATASDISWDFAGGVGAQFTIQPSGPPTTQFNVYTNRYDVDFNGIEYANYQSGEEVIANNGTEVAEPGTLSMLFSGLLGLGLLVGLKRYRVNRLAIEA